MKKYSSEYKFLISISRKTLDDDRSDYIRYYMKKGGQWNYIYQKAVLEGVSGLLFYHLKRLDLLNNLPVLFRKELETEYKTILKINLDYMAYLLNIEEILKANNIHAMVLQGLSVLKIYGDPGLRPMSDVDILVKPEHKKIILNSLKKSGFYNPYPHEPDLLIKSNMLLDIHTHPLNIDRIRARKYFFPEDITGFWERASSFSGADKLLLCMDIYDSFLCLSAHALKHCYSKLIWLCDLNELLQEILKDKKGWNNIIRRTEVCRQERVLVYSLMMLEQVYGFNVPMKVKKKLDFSRTNIVEKRIICLISEGVKFEIVSVILWFFNIKGIINKIQFLKESILPRKEIMARMVKKRSVKVRGRDYSIRIFYILRTVGRDLTRILTGQ